MNIDEIKELVKHMAERNKDAILDNSFNLQVNWHEADGKLRVSMLPKLTPGESRAPLMWAMSVLSATQRDIGYITLLHDSFQAKGKPEAGMDGVTKHDGTPWGPGEMQYAVENNTVDADLVTEAFVFTIIHANGVITLANLPYSREDGDIIFDWDNFMTQSDDEGGSQYGGNFPDALRAAIAETGKAQQVTKPLREILGMDEATANMHLLAVGVKMVMQQVRWQCMVPAYSEEERDLLKNSFNNGPLSEGIRAFSEEEVEEIVQLEEAFDLPDAVK